MRFFRFVQLATRSEYRLDELTEVLILMFMRLNEAM